MWPDPYPDTIHRFSISNPNDELAVSEQDFIAHYTDTLTNPSYVQNDPIDGRRHVPLNIEINQRSYAWSYSYAEDFVLFDYSITNIGRRTLSKVYMGLYVDADVGPIGGNVGDFTDDICGFRRTIPSPLPNNCGWIDTINIAWISDNDGMNNADGTTSCSGDDYPTNSPTGVTGMRVVRTPSDSLKYSFNWWISNGNAALDFGPRKVGTPDDPFRDWGFLGTPAGDRNKYYVMRHEEFDYDQLFCGKDNTSEGYLPRPVQAADFANGFDTRYLLSFGPFNIDPGEVLPVSFAYIAGEDFHRPLNCEAFNEKFRVNYPEDFYSELDFEDFGQNAVWASWIYDNPGIDTDLDGDSGKYRICVYDSALIDGVYEPTVADTVYYEGDGVPDFKGAAPPPAPELWVINNYPRGDTVRALITPSLNEFNRGEAKVQFYGLRSETTKDAFSGAYDFEGYRVYISLSPVASDFVLVSSYDIIDYNRYEFNSLRNEWELNDLPFSLDSLRALYGDGFNPDEHPRDRPLITPSGEIYYFLAQDWNNANLSDANQIHKMYPDEPKPESVDHEYAAIHTPEVLTEYGYFKYYMYEYIVRDLLPGQRYYFSVTAFDYGSPKSKLQSLETPPNRNVIAEYPQNSNSIAEENGLNVVVYPNPYRYDGNYRELGFEARETTGQHESKTRRIHFTNLPHKCTIRIYTLDGDLVREIVHDEPKDFPESMHETWDLITRNTQAVVSGIYYYSVESEFGNQIGKIVIIM
jgi:hypothetical protein